MGLAGRVVAGALVFLILWYVGDVIYTSVRVGQEMNRTFEQMHRDQPALDARTKITPFPTTPPAREADPSPPAGDPPTGTLPDHMTASEFLSMFRESYLDANYWVAGHTLRISGTVESTTSAPSVFLSVEAGKRPDRLELLLPPSMASVVAGLVPGQSLTVVGAYDRDRSDTGTVRFAATEILP